MFESSIVNGGGGMRRPASFLLSLAGQATLLTGVVVAGMIQVGALPKPEFVHIGLPLGKPQKPKAAPVKPRVTVDATRPVKFAKLIYYTERAPAGQVVLIDSAAPEGSDNGTGIVTGLPPGYASGPCAGCARIDVPPPPPRPVEAPPVTAEKKIAPIRVGGDVQAAKLIAGPRPAYPPLARAARVSGTVRIEAIIARDGVIRDLRAVNGHPLLTAAALDAVRQWRYTPTLLNGEPVEVITQIEVNFTLSQ